MTEGASQRGHIAHWTTSVMQHFTTDLVSVARECHESLSKDGITLRAFGSCGVRLKCGTKVALLDRCHRRPKDIDAVIRRRDRTALRQRLLRQGWEEDIELMAQTDGWRLRFFKDGTGILMDVSVDRLRFAQTLDMRDRLNIDEPAIPAADLILSKLQIPRLRLEDLIDIVSLLVAIPVSNHNDLDISLARLIDVTSRCWRWYTSVQTGLKRVEEAIGDASVGLSATERSTALPRLRNIQQAIDSARKPFRWRLRSVVGGLLPLFDTVEQLPPRP